MTNNEVIIDDKCICYDEGECYNDNCPNRYCEDNNCEHKQLIAKSAECENNLTAYKNELTIYDTECGKLIAEIDNLLIENENKSAECEKLESALEETIKVLQRCVDCASKNHYSCGTCGRYDLLQKIKKIVKEQE